MKNKNLRKIKKIGSGAFGYVFMAEYSREGFDFSRKVALKYLKNLNTFNEKAFVSEIKVLAKLSHPNICQFIDAGIDETGLYYIVEFIDGCSLEKLKGVGQLSPIKTKFWLRCLDQALKALEYLHREAQIVHHDISPHNIMIDKTGQIKLLDFGVSQSVHEQSDDIKGKVSYLHPDVLNKKRNYDELDDVFSVVKVFFELAFNLSSTDIASEAPAPFKKIFHDVQSRHLTIFELRNLITPYIEISNIDFEKYLAELLDQTNNDQTIIERKSTSKTHITIQKKTKIIILFVAIFTILLMIYNRPTDVSSKLKFKVQIQSTGEIREFKFPDSDFLPDEANSEKFSDRVCEALCVRGSSQYSALSRFSYKDFLERTKFVNITWERYRTEVRKGYKKRYDTFISYYSHCSRKSLCEMVKDDGSNPSDDQADKHYLKSKKTRFQYPDLKFDVVLSESLDLNMIKLEKVIDESSCITVSYLNLFRLGISQAKLLTTSEDLVIPSDSKVKILGLKGGDLLLGVENESDPIFSQGLCHIEIIDLKVKKIQYWRPGLDEQKK